MHALPRQYTDCLAGSLTGWHLWLTRDRLSRRDRVLGSRRLLVGAIAACVAVALAITGVVMLTDTGSDLIPGPMQDLFPKPVPCPGGWSAVSQF